MKRDKDVLQQQPGKSVSTVTGNVDSCLVKDRTLQELSAFASAVVQEARAPLRHVEAFAQLLKQRATRWDEESLHYLEALLQGARELRDFFEVLLRYARATSKALHPERVDLSALAAKVVGRLQRQHPQRALQVRIEPGIVVYADPELTELLLGVLLENAWKFTRRTPGALIEVGIEASGEPTTFFVRDSGIGFPSERTHELFLPGARLHPRHEFEGSGFGLATAACIVKRHGGSISAYAQPGRGATFVVTLPSRGR